MFRVFISSSINDMYIVNELTNILNKYGIETSVPWNLPTNIEYTRAIYQQIYNSDCILVIISLSTGYYENVNYEIKTAKSLSKTIIPLIEYGAYIPNNLRDKDYILIDRMQPRLSYENAAKYLHSLKIQKERKNGIGGLILLGLGLLLLAALSSEENNDVAPR